jgi:hypothetical protein
VQRTNPSGAAWCKSSRSNHGDANQTNCVEVAELPNQVAMRDSKDPTGPVLTITPTE